MANYGNEYINEYVTWRNTQYDRDIETNDNDADSPWWPEQELVLAAVKHHGQSLADAHESLQGDREVWQGLAFGNLAYLHHVQKRTVEDDLAEVEWTFLATHRLISVQAGTSSCKCKEHDSCEQSNLSKGCAFPTCWKTLEVESLSCAATHQYMRLLWSRVESGGRVVQIPTISNQLPAHRRQPQLPSFWHHPPSHAA